MPENLQLESIAYWGEAIVKVQKRLRAIRTDALSANDETDPLWDHVDRLVRLESYATRCLALAKIGRLKPFVSPFVVSNLAFLDNL